MKILVIGDPHGELEKIKKISLKGIDEILLTGDLGKADLARKRFFENLERKRQGLGELEDDATWARKVHGQVHNSTLGVLRYLSKCAPVYTLQGNVGIYTSSRVRKDEEKYGIKLASTREIINRMKDVHLVKNSLRVIKRLRVGFLENYSDVAWVKEFKPTDYAEKMQQAREETEKAKRVLRRFSNLDILVCHQPPYGVLDKVTNPAAPKEWQGKHAGGKAILDYVLKAQPRYVFCGHIHEGEGTAKIGKTEVYNLGVGGHKIIELD